MIKDYRRVNGNIKKCNIWDLKEYKEIFRLHNWKREYKGKEFLDILGLTPPNQFLRVACSGDSVFVDGKEIFGVDIFRADRHGENKESVYHYFGINMNDEIVMSTEPSKLEGEHHVKDKEDFEEKHDN